MTPVELSRFEAKSHVEPNTGCILWTGSTSQGYGTFRVSGRHTKAHRAAYEHAHGPIPPGLCIDHLCRTPACVNPDHLEPVTPKENVRRGLAGILCQRVSHCCQGHPYSVANTGVRVDGQRWCRACAKARKPRSSPWRPIHSQPPTECTRGHVGEYYTRPNGKHMCRGCNRDRMRDAHRTKRLAKENH